MFTHVLGRGWKSISRIQADSLSHFPQKATRVRTELPDEEDHTRAGGLPSRQPDVVDRYDPDSPTFISPVKRTVRPAHE
jgi:hypothetical protein